VRGQRLRDGLSDRLVGVLGFNRPRHVMKYRNLIEQGTSFDDAVKIAESE